MGDHPVGIEMLRVEMQLKSELIDRVHNTGGCR